MVTPRPGSATAVTQENPITAAGPFQDHDVSPRMVKGRSILRLAQRVASVLSCRPARCKAVHPDRNQRRVVIPAMAGAGQAPGGTGPLHQPRAGYRVESGGVSPGDDPPDRGLRRRPGARPRGPAPPVQPVQHISGHISGPAGDRGEGPGPSDHRRGGQRQHRRHRMIPPLARPPVAHPSEQFRPCAATSACSSRPRAAPASP